jgi:hypothetical protein
MVVDARMRFLIAALLVVDAASQSDNPADPPFDMTRVLYSAAFSDHMVLQRAPQQSSVFGTATPGATIVVSMSGPNNYSFISRRPWL